MKTAHGNGVPVTTLDTGEAWHFDGDIYRVVSHSDKHDLRQGKTVDLRHPTPLEWYAIAFDLIGMADAVRNRHEPHQRESFEDWKSSMTNSLPVQMATKLGWDMDLAIVSRDRKNPPLSQWERGFRIGKRHFRGTSTLLPDHGATVSDFMDSTPHHAKPNT